MNLGLNGKNAIVCGSTQGIGKCIALGLAEMGASVTLIARNENKLKEVVQELDTTSGQQHQYLAADFSNFDEVKEKVADYMSNNYVHILINNTGGPAGGPITDATIEAFHAAFNMHLVCNHILAQAVVPSMKEAGFGRIINVVSTSIKQPLSGLGVSNTTRGAVASWAKTMSNELAPFNITVNNVLPGATNTVRLKSIIEAKAAKAGVDKEKISEHMRAEVPMNRFAEPEEVANVACFLASPAAGYVTGVSIPVDGGRTSCL